MGNPIDFKPKKVDPRVELQRKLDAAPLEHAEALLVAFDVLEAAHEKGLLDLMHAAIASKNSVIGKVAEYAKEPVSIQAMRNLLILGRALGSIDPELLHETESRLSTEESPSLWRSIRRIFSRDGRNGIHRASILLAALGRTQSSK